MAAAAALFITWSATTGREGALAIAFWFVLSPSGFLQLA
jgi:hypothetical protein